jgi:hypothetical protein
MVDLILRIASLSWDESLRRAEWNSVDAGSGSGVSEWERRREGGCSSSRSGCDPYEPRMGALPLDPAEREKDRMGKREGPSVGKGDDMLRQVMICESVRLRHELGSCRMERNALDKPPRAEALTTSSKRRPPPSFRRVMNAS